MTVVFKAPNSRRLYHLLMSRWSLKDFPGSPMIKTSPSSARDEGSVPGQEDPTCLGAKKLKHETQEIL